ncbi:hypothetical protein [Pseudonocardia sp.]|uniref:hypothetical protein n=1 Tax=Pseudonocardia sp. TaxID=60912 RepID=UPI002620C962|nr:hypothetical protein [Pseudonocardia sp.]MCW2717493.1 hypothetical protein [Pseudonocardia sp.]MDT7618391.1 hypothetical protein [Pseudonocardiales bacterium]
MGRELLVDTEFLACSAKATDQLYFWATGPLQELGLVWLRTSRAPKGLNLSGAEIGTDRLLYGDDVKRQRAAR